MKNILITLMLLIASVKLHAQIDTNQHVYLKPLFDFDYNSPTFKLAGEQLSNKNRFLRYFLLTGYREGVESVTGSYGLNWKVVDDPETGTRKIVFYNESILNILSIGWYKDRFSDVVLEVKDPSKYRYDPSQEDKTAWLRKNGHCFEMVYPKEAYNDVNLLENTLKHAFPGLRFGVEKRTVNVLILVRTSQIDKLKSKGEGTGFYDKTGYFNNIPLAEGRLGDFLYQADMPRVIDETGYTGNVDMELNIQNWKDLAEVRAAIRHYDLDLKEEKREIDVFVIHELDQK